VGETRRQPSETCQSLTDEVFDGREENPAEPLCFWPGWFVYTATSLVSQSDSGIMRGVRATVRGTEADDGVDHREHYQADHARGDEVGGPGEPNT